MRSAMTFSVNLLRDYPRSRKADSTRPSHRGLLEDHPSPFRWTCDEIYSIRPDGTTLVTSAEEISESVYEISDDPSEKGFYRWVDTITKDNGKKACLGQTMGHVATNHIVFHSSGDMFLICIEERLESCIGPFVRQKDSDA
jgi:hypothetical protein